MLVLLVCETFRNYDFGWGEIVRFACLATIYVVKFLVCMTCCFNIRYVVCSGYKELKGDQKFCTARSCLSCGVDLTFDDKIVHLFVPVLLLHWQQPQLYSYAVLLCRLLALSIFTCPASLTCPVPVRLYSLLHGKYFTIL